MDIKVKNQKTIKAEPQLVQKPKMNLSVWFYRARQFAALALLSAGALAYIADNIEKVVTGWLPYAVASGVVALVLFFGLKK